MKTYPSIESLAKDLQVSERTGWRWLDKGTVVRVKGNDGKVVFALSAETDGCADVRSEGVNDKKEPVREKPQEGIKLREPDNPVVREKSRQVDVLKLNIESLEAENKIEELSQKKAEKTLARDRSREIQLVKEIVIPHGLRVFLPPDVLLISLRMIDQTLKGINFSLEECIALAQSVIWIKYWGGNPTIYGVVRPAIVNWIFETLFQNLKDGYAEAMIKGYEGTFNDFLSYIFLSMAPDEQAKISSFAYRKAS